MRLSFRLFRGVEPRRTAQTESQGAPIVRRRSGHDGEGVAGVEGVGVVVGRARGGRRGAGEEGIVGAAHPVVPIQWHVALSPRV